MLAKVAKQALQYLISMRTIEYVKTFKFSVVIEKDEGGFFVECPTLQGCHSHGKTYEEALASIKAAIELHLEDRRKNDEEIPTPKAIGLPTVEVTV